MAAIKLVHERQWTLDDLRDHRSSMVVYNRWTGTVEWNGGME